MKKNLLILSLTLLYLAKSYGQLADITYSIRTGNITSYENATGGDCWETGTEEYTGYLDSWDNVNSTWVGTGCRTCDNNGNCTYASDIALQTRSNNAYTVTFRIDAWEDDRGGRCSYDGPCLFCDADDCRRNETNTTDIRELAYPSNGTYTNTSTWGSTGNHTYYFKCTWKYSGTANLITPSASCQSANVATGAIRSWSVNMTAGTTYAFSNYGSGADTKIRIYNTDGYTIMASNDDNGPHVAGSAASIEYTAPSTGTYYVELSNFDRSELTTNSTLSYWIKPTSIAGFGSNTWNILGYNKSDLALSSNTYVGYYNVNSLSYNTSSGPGIYTNTPTDATGWTGGCVHPDYHTVVAKRQGFPCKIYQLDIPNHDDDIRVFVNGNQVYEHLGCCDNHSNIWTGYLTSTSTIEVRHIDGVGGSNQGLTLTDVTTALNGGSIAGITNGTTICTGGDPGAFTSTASGSGGTIGITNGSPSAETYQWESSTTSSTTGYSNIGGATSTTYDPGALTATTWFRRRVTDACGTVSYSNVIQVVVVADPTAPTATKSPAVATVCAGATLTLTGPTAGAGGTGTCNFEYRYSFDGVGYTSWNTSVPSITAVTGTNYIEIRTNCSGIGCDISPTTSYSWTVAADPTAPTNTPTPSASTVCVGATLSVSAGGSSGGTGTCAYEYAIDPGTGTFGTWGATNSVTASSIGNGTYRIKSRRNCNGNGCDISPESAITSWTVVADPTVPTITPTPSVATVCVGSSLSATASGSTGGTGTCSYEYAIDPGTGTFGAWGATNSVTASSAGTYKIKARRNCNGTSCDISPETTTTWTVVADPSAPTATKSPAATTVCAGATLTLTSPTSGGGGTGTCNFEYRYSTDNGGTYSAWSTSVPSFSAVIGTNIIQIRTNCDGNSCDISTATSYSWTVVADPSAPTNTPTPSVSTVCVGATLSVAASGSSGGTGTCTYEYAIDPGTGTFGTWGATNSVTASGTGTYRMKSRMNCNGNGCDISPESAITTWTVVADPTAPTATKSPTDASVCAGQTLTLTSPTIGTGGTGTCNFEYRYNTGGGFSAWGTSIPSFTAVTGTNTIEIRTNCNGNSCDPSTASSYSWTVAADPSAPTGMTKSPSDASLCVGATLTVSGATPGSGGTGTCNVEYRYSTNNGGSYTGWTTSVPSISAVLGTTIIQASTICTGLACDRSATSQVSWIVVADPSAPTATKSPNTTFACDGEVITLTNITDNGGGAGTCDIEFALDPGSGTYGSWTTTVPSYTVVAPSGDVRIKMRKNCNASACDISSETLYSWDIFTKSTAPMSLIPTATYVCAGSTVYLLVNGGSLGNDGSQWYLYDADPNAGGNLLASNASGFFTISNISGTYDYYVRAEGDCGVTNTVNALVVTSAGTDASTYDDCLVSSTTSNTCNVSGSQTHYFVNSSNCEIFQINSNGANLGSTTLTSTVAGNGPVGDGGTVGDASGCTVADGGPGGEYHVERVFNFSSANSPSGANITLTQCITDAEYNNYEGLAAFTDPDYQRCYGTTTTAADLSITCFNSGGNVAYVGSPTYSSKTLGGNTVHCYTFTIASSNLRTRGTSESNITTYGDCECYLHSSGGEGGPLPIELTNFTGTYTNNAVRLDWATASEKNNDFFELMRSTDGTNFEVIATVDSKAPSGNSNYPISYEHFDNDPMGGIVYYQLKQTDFDGATTLSKIVSVEIPEQLKISEFRPNPAKNDVSVVVNTVKNTDIQFALISIDGRVLIEKNYNFTKGINNINLSLSSISSGTYIGEFIIDGKKYHKKLIIAD